MVRESLFNCGFAMRIVSTEEVGVELGSGFAIPGFFCSNLAR
jgi:hypothetical protein